MHGRERVIPWYQWLHVVVLLTLTGAVFALDLWTPLGIAVWLLYFIPMWYAMRFVRLGRMTVLTATAVALACTALIVLGFFYSTPGIDPKVALINRSVGVGLLWFGAILLAWFANRKQTLRETAAALQDKEARVRQALEAAQMATWEWDLRTGVMRWGGLREMVAGLPLRSFGTTYQDFMAVLHPDDRARVHAEWERALQLGAEYAGEYRFVHPDGQVRWIAGRGQFAVADADQIRMTGCCWDITDRKQAEEALRADEERTRILSEGVANYGLFMLDPEGRVSSWNSGAEELTGYQAEDMLGREYAFLYPDNARSEGNPQQDLQAAAAAWDGRCEKDDWRMRRDGTQFAANVVLTIVRDDAGNVHGYTVVMRDATMRKQAEQEIENGGSLATLPAPRSSRRFLPKVLIRNINQAARTFAPGRRKR